MFISVRQTKADAALTNPSWLSLIPTIIAICILGVALVIGYVTNVRWLMRLGT